MRLFLIPETIDAILTESHLFSIEYSFDGLFIEAQCGVATLQFEKYDLSKSSLRESIEDDIVSAFPDEYHIFWCIREVRKYGKDLLIELSEDLIPIAPEDGFPDILVLEEREDAHDRHTDQESEDESDDQGQCIHFLSF